MEAMRHGALSWAPVSIRPRRNPSARLVLLALLVVATASPLGVPGANAQASDIQVVESSIDITLPLDVERSTEQYVRNVPAGSGSPVTPPALVYACGPDHIDTVPLDDRIVFQEGLNETGCGEARFRLAIPEGAKSIAVRFNATRQIASVNERVDVQRPVAVQEVRLVGDPNEVIQTHRYFAPSDDDTSDPVARESGPWSLQQEQREHLVLSWYFADDGMDAGQQIPITPTGHSFEATVQRPTVTWGGVPMPLAGPVERSASIVGTDIETKFRLSARLRVADYLALDEEGGPYHMDRARFSFTLKVSEQNRLVSVTGPDGEPIDSAGFELTRASGILTIRIIESATLQHGEGLYTLVFTTTGPVQGADSFKPFAVASLFLPLPVGVMAWIAARRFERRVGHAFATTTLMLKAGVLLASVYYGVVLVLGLRADRIELMSSWPLPVAGGLLYGLLLLAFVLFVALWLFGDRYLTQAMSRSIAEHERMGRELKERSGELESFVYAVSHDLKTPLVSLEWLVHSLEETLDDKKTKKEREDALRQILMRIHANIDGMDNLISDLLELSRVGRVEGAASPVDLAETVKSVVEGVEAQRRDHGVHIEVAAASLPVILADRTRMEQVLRNLVGNAIKYGRMKDGHIRVRAYLEERPHLGDRLHIEIDDNGPGVPEEFREQVFMLFQRAPDPYGRPIQGTGVGLALARKIARSYGGDVTVSDSDLGGARFVFTLPASRIVPGRGARTAPTPDGETRPGGGRRRGAAAGPA